MLHNWSDIYQAQIGDGDHWRKLKPVISIWLLTENMIKDDNEKHHHFQLWDNANQRLLTDHCSIHVIELKKWKNAHTLLKEDYWLYFFREGKHWKELPDCLKHSGVMRQAMKVMRTFSGAGKSVPQLSGPPTIYS